MKLVCNQLPKGAAEIVLFYDLHIGSSKCDIKLIQDRIKYVQDKPNRYAIIGGDIINNSTKTSVGDVYSEPLTPMQQVQLATSLFKPIADRILCITSGNHERRSYKTDGIDLAYFLASELGCEDKYDYTAVLSFIKLGEGTNDPLVTLYMTHGDGNGGRTIGGKANGLERRGDIIDADIIVAGHTHQPFTTRRCSYVCDRIHRRVCKHEQVLVNAASTLDYEEYAELFGMRPSSTVNPRIVIGPTQGRQAEIVVLA